MDLRKEYGTDKKKEVEGIWEDFSEGIRLLIARYNNPNYRDMQTAEITKSPRKYRNKKTTDPIMKSLQIKCCAKHVLLGWEGIDWNGEDDVEYSVELAEEMLTELPDFYDEVVGIAANFENYRSANVEEDSGN